MPESKWKPLSEAAALRRADEKYLREERVGKWSAWKGDGPPPWWTAGFVWVETVITAFAERVLTTERCFDDSLRGRLYGESRKQAVAIYDRKIWHHDAPLSDLVKRREFVDWVVREIAPLLALMDQEVMICTEPDELDGRESLGSTAGTAAVAPVDVTKRSEQRRAFVIRILDRKGWSIFDLAVKASVDPNTVYDYLKGLTRPYRSTRAKLAESLGVEVDELPN